MKQRPSTKQYLIFSLLFGLNQSVLAIGSDAPLAIGSLSDISYPPSFTSNSVYLLTSGTDSILSTQKRFLANVTVNGKLRPVNQYLYDIHAVCPRFQFSFVTMHVTQINFDPNERALITGYGLCVSKSYTSPISAADTRVELSYGVYGSKTDNTTMGVQDLLIDPNTHQTPIAQFVWSLYCSPTPIPYDTIHCSPFQNPYL